MVTVRGGSSPRDEERAARAAQRRLDKMQRAARKARGREERSAVRRAVAEVLATSQGKRCECGLRKVSTREELSALGSGCTAGRWVCPALDAVRRRLS